MSERIHDTLQVVVPNGVVIAVIQIADVRDVATICMTALSIAYTFWRWHKDSSKK